MTAFPGGSAADEASVSPLLRHGEKLHSAMRIEARGCTPLSEALWWVMQQMVVLSETRKIILILTDGRPSNVVQTREALRNAKKYGFEVYGLGYRCRETGCVLPPESRMVRELKDVPPAMFELLQEALTRKGQRGRV